MARLFALADLHLSGTGDKPMDRFGEIWVRHPEKMAANWDRLVAEEDLVLLPGDLSWGRSLEEAEPDLAWIEARPGRKLLLKGNHDGWWGSISKVRKALPPSCEALWNDSHPWGDWAIVGARGWTDPEDPIAIEGDEKIFKKELERLKHSLRDADRRWGRDRPRIAMLHYPPRLKGRRPSVVVELLEKANVRICLYGHLHGSDHALAFEGEIDGVDYRFVATDAVNMTPVKILDREEV